MIVVAPSTQSFDQDLLTTISNEETCLQNVLVVLKRMLLENLEDMSPLYYMYSDVYNALLYNSVLVLLFACG